MAADNGCRVVVLTGAGRAFCSGLELEHAGLPPGTDDLGRHRLGMRAMEYMGGIVPALRALPQPVIAAIHGPAYGGGMCLSLGADIRLAGESAVFCGAGISNGLTGAELGVTWLLPRAVGTSDRAFAASTRCAAIPTAKSAASPASYARRSARRRRSRSKPARAAMTGPDTPRATTSTWSNASMCQEACPVPARVLLLQVVARLLAPEYDFTCTARFERVSNVR